MCKICLSLVKRPKTCQSCDDLYCSECLNKALKENNSCPNCRAKPFKEYRLNRIAKDIYNRIEINCPLGCDENFVMENLDKHLSLCKRREKHHECNLCKEILKSQIEVDLHKELCQELMLHCDMCNLDFKNKEFQEHKKCCIESYVICGECSCVIPSKYKGSHKDYFSDFLMSVREKALKIQEKFIELGVF